MVRIKKTILVSCIFLAQLAVFSQEKKEDLKKMSTLFTQNENNIIGGYGGPVLKVSEISNKTVVFTGGKGGVILNHKWIFGIEGYILNTDISSKNEEDIDFVYAGIFAGHVFNWDKTFHFNTGLMLGWGGIGYHKNRVSNTDFINKYILDDNLLVIEPNVELEVNIAKNFRIGVGVNYRKVFGVDLPVYNSSKLSGFSGALSFKFGKF